jgi:hypothetical protein
MVQLKSTYLLGNFFFPFRLKIIFIGDRKKLLRINQSMQLPPMGLETDDELKPCEGILDTVAEVEKLQA